MVAMGTRVRNTFIEYPVKPDLGFELDLASSDDEDGDIENSRTQSDPTGVNAAFAPRRVALPALVEEDGASSVNGTIVVEKCAVKTGDDQQFEEEDEEEEGEEDWEEESDEELELSRTLSVAGAAEAAQAWNQRRLAAAARAPSATTAAAAAPPPLCSAQENAAMPQHSSASSSTSMAGQLALAGAVHSGAAAAHGAAMHYVPCAVVLAPVLLHGAQQQGELAPQTAPAAAAAASSAPAVAAAKQAAAAPPAWAGGCFHRFHREATSFCSTPGDLRSFAKGERFQGRLSLVTEAEVHRGGVHKYLVELTAGRLSRADGIGFVFNSRLPCTKDIQKIVSVYLNQQGECGLRFFQETWKSPHRVPRLKIGDWVQMEIDLGARVVRFKVWRVGADQSQHGHSGLVIHSSTELAYGGILDDWVCDSGKTVCTDVGHLACVVKNAGATMTLGS